MKTNAPNPAVRRLSLYLRQLEHLAQQGREKVSSSELAEALYLTAAKVRKDLAWFGQFGSPGVGYAVMPLIGTLRGILGTDRTWPVIVVGAGDLGRALLRYRGFASKGFELVAAFDVASGKIGRRIGRVPVYALDELPDVVAEHNVRLAIVTVPEDAAQDVAEKLCDAGIRGILNFAPTTLHLPKSTALGRVDLPAHLEQLSFQVRAAENEKTDADKKQKPRKRKK